MGGSGGRGGEATVGSRGARHRSACRQTAQTGELMASPVAREEWILREQMRARLEGLRKEFETGQAELERVERQRTYLRETVLRIGGAMQVLEELLAEDQPTEHNGTDPGNTPPVTNLSNE